MFSFLISFHIEAFDLLFWRDHLPDDVYRSHNHYEFDSCKHLENFEDVYQISCIETLDNTLSQELQSLLNTSLELSKRDFESEITRDLRRFILDEIKSQYEWQMQLRNCFSLIAGRHDGISDWCYNKASVMREDIVDVVSQLRLHLAFSGDRSALMPGVAPRFRYRSDIRHPHSDQNFSIPPIQEQSEIDLLEEAFEEEIIEYTQSWLERREADSCVTEADGEFQFKNASCSSANLPFLNDYLNMRMERATDDHRNRYHQLIGLYPYALFIQDYPLPEDENLLNIILANSLDDLSAQLLDQYQELENRSEDNFYFLHRYPNLVESYLKKYGANSLSCDALQTLYRRHGEGQRNDLLADVGIAAGAVLGGGACILTSGLVCALGVAVGTEALFIGKDQRRLNEGLGLYRAQLIEGDRVDDLYHNRNLSLAFAPLSFVGLEGARGVQSGMRSRSLSRRFRENLYFSPTSPEQNSTWIQRAREGRGDFYLDIENGALKRLNDTIGDKNIVTVMTNLHKRILFEELESLSSTFPNVEIYRYSDFKSSRFSFDFPNGQQPEGFTSELQSLYARVSQRFDREVREAVDIDLSTENPAGWFSAGSGQSADQAGLAARQSRNLDRSVHQVRNFNEVTPLLSELRESIEISRLALQREFVGTPLNRLIQEEREGVFMPTLEVFEVMRKNMTSSLDHLSEVFIRRFNVDISHEQLQTLKNYIRDVDRFSPGIWIEERTLANLDLAEYGGFSVDFKGLGAQNIRQVALDLSHVDDPIDASIRRLREGEGRVTDLFSEGRNGFVELMRRELDRMEVSFVHQCSGDDCVFLPSRPLSEREQRVIADAMSSQVNPSNQRVSFIPPGIRPEYRSELAVHGELIEKNVRSLVEGYLDGMITPEVMGQVSLAVRMPTTLGQGSPQLISATSDSISTAPHFQESLERAFTLAIRKANSELGTSYSP